MRVLVALAQPPDPQGGAAGRCAWALLQGLRAHGLDVRVIAARRKPAMSAFEEDPSVEVVDVASRGASVRERLGRFREPRGELAGAFAERVRAEAQRADVVHLDEFETTWCATPGLPNVLHLHYLIDQDRGPGRPWRRSFFTYVEERLAQRRAVSRHRELIANSSRVADLLGARAPSARVTVMPLSLDPEQYRNVPPNEPLAGLIGTLDWAPTADAVGRLLAQTWPEVRRQVPDARLVIAGRGTESLAVTKGVEVAGSVRSSADFFARLALLLYPVARGSGMKVKVLEAMASGVPVVTTRIGAEGIAPNDGVVVAGAGSELDRAAAQILRDPDEQRQRGEAALACFAERYAPRPATEPLLALYATIAGAQRSSRAP